MDTSKLKEIGEMMVEQGQSLISMAGVIPEEKENEMSEESEESAPMPGKGMMGPKNKEMIIMSLKKKLRGE